MEPRWKAPHLCAYVPRTCTSVSESTGNTLPQAKWRHDFFPRRTTTIRERQHFRSWIRPPGRDAAAGFNNNNSFKFTPFWSQGPRGWEHSEVQVWTFVKGKRTSDIHFSLFAALLMNSAEAAAGAFSLRERQRRALRMGSFYMRTTNKLHEWKDHTFTALLWLWWKMVVMAVWGQSNCLCFRSK